MINSNSLCIVNNIPTPYRRDLFDEIFRQAEVQGISFTVFYLAETETVRNWKVELSSFETVLPVLWQKRNVRTPTSDYIFNTGYLSRIFRPRHVILFGYNYITYIFIAIVRAITKRPTHLFCETTMSDSSANVLKIKMKSIFFKLFFDRFIVPGQRSRDYLLAHGIPQEQISVVRNASSIRPDRLIEPCLGNNLRLLFVGRLSLEKRILEFSRAFAQITTSSTLTLVGSGPLTDEINKVIEHCPRIVMLGEINSNDLTKIYSQHDVLVLVSDSEPWGLVVNEAVNHGLALMLSPQVGSSPDLLDGNGVYLSEISPGRISLALDEITKNFTVFRYRSLKIAEETTVAKQASGLLAVVK